eukprot:CAMPEP_0201488840 /NCGR_PEP_ID=MMETSP0151_2-20130828/19747_1 /ASSEMBLY_ACC=CAM_ASM_000257 /TAXON_ID=200890 /ORGANISM="Paramoeba atlantica, Strain 621/1 / CCAP 1560/9" /LENGTH=354 /DNA_ID=CAMNT_0047874215 /DNA_START=222 /DNA_END=1286 /DNA_ORIENTATION=+
MNRLVVDGVSTDCPSFESSSCASAHMGNRFAPTPIDYTQLGPHNVSTPEDVTTFAQTYHWTSFSGYGSMTSGLDAPHHLIKLNTPEDGVTFFQVLESSGGTFFRRAKKNGKKTALAATPSFLTSDWNTESSLGVLDYECGFETNTSLPLVQPKDVSSCNLHYRFAVSEEEYGTFRDDLARDWISMIVQRGCAHVNAVHFKSPDAVMHAAGIGSLAYNETLIYVDSLVGSVLDEMERQSSNNGYRWLTFLTSDHGGIEADQATYITITPELQRLDHDRNWLYDEAVPFVMTGVGKDAPNVFPFTQPVRHFDIYPTVLDFLDVGYLEDQLDAKVQGSSAGQLVLGLSLLVGLLNFW